MLLFALALAGISLLALRQVRRRRLAAGRLLFPGTWIAVHWAFVLWFFPGERDHFVETVFPLLLAGALVLHASVESPALRRAGLACGLALIAAGAAWNAAHVAVPRHRDRGPFHREAAALARLGLVGQSLVLADHHVMVHLATSFGSRHHADVQLLLLSLYRDGGPGRDAPSISGAERVLVPLRHVVPDCRVGPYSGWTHPEGWLAFVRWVTDCRPADRAQPGTHAALETVETDSGERVLLVDPDRRSAGDLGAVLSALDELAGPGGAGFVAAGTGQAGRQ